MKSCPANVVIIDKYGKEEFECKGRYYADGRLLCQVGERQMLYDPQHPYDEDLKRLFLIDTEKWSKFCIKSVILDSRYIRKVG
jgi:hypothetical protein